MRPIRSLICLALLSFVFDAHAQDGLSGLRLTSKLSPPHTWHQGSDPAADAAQLDLALTQEVSTGVVGRLVMAAADSMVGTRYRLGSDTESALDCSAFVRRAFGIAGMDLPRSTRELILLGEKIDESELAPGDLLFYRWNRGLHVALYAGNGEIFHASPTAHQVIRTHLTEDWNRRLVSARRLI